MKRVLVAVGVSMAAAAATAGAQSPAPPRSPEVQRLEGYVGDWTFEERVRDSANGPEQTLAGTWQARRLGDQIEWRARFAAGGQEVTSVEVEGWDPSRKAEYGSWFDSTGARGTFTGSWAATTSTLDATWVSADGKAAGGRCAFAWGDFTAVEYRCERGDRGKTWVFRTGRGVKVVPITTTAMGTGGVLGIHEVVLKPGVAPADFERFVVENWGPTLEGVFPGVHNRVYKGERGRAPGTYLLVYDIDSLRARDHYFPGGNALSDAGQFLWKQCGERCDRAWNRFAELTSTIGFTDYYALTRK